MSGDLESKELGGRPDRRPAPGPDPGECTIWREVDNPLQRGGRNGFAKRPACRASDSVNQPLTELVPSAPEVRDTGGTLAPVLRDVSSRRARKVRATPLSAGELMLRETVDAIEELRELRRGWDSHSGKPISAHSRAAARRFVEAVTNSVGDEYSSPIVGPTASGGVALIWRRSRSRHKVEVFVSAVGALPRYLVLADGRVVASGHVDDPKAFAAEIIQKYVTD
jgi:hypothetical protein